LTFFIQVKLGQIYKIQLNLFSVKSWSQVFLVYHTDLVCIGYEVLTNKFIYMKNRFENILTKQVHYFSNIFNFDSGCSLQEACLKYISRGFNCQIILLRSQPETSEKKEKKQGKMNGDLGLIEILIEKYYGDAIYIASSTEHNDDRIDLTYLPHILFDLYGNSDNFVSSSSIVHLFEQNELMVPMIYLSIYQIDKYPDRRRYLNINMDTFRFQSRILKSNQDSNYFLGVKCWRCHAYIPIFNASHKCMRSYSNIFVEYKYKLDMLII